MVIDLPFYSEPTENNDIFSTKGKSSSTSLITAFEASL